MIVDVTLTPLARFHDVLLHSAGLLFGDDIPRRATLWPLKSTRIPFYLLFSGLGLHHGSEGVWYRSKAHSSRPQSIHASEYLSLCYGHCRMHSCANELLQQSVGYVLH